MADESPRVHDLEMAPPVFPPGHGALAHLRHELRTPLNHMVGYSEMLLEEMADRAETALSPKLTEVCAASKQLIETVAKAFSHGDVAPDLSGEDLRLPLQVVLDRSERLVEEARALGEESWGRDLTRIVAAARQLSVLVQSVGSGGLVATGAPVAAVRGAIPISEPLPAGRLEPPCGLVLVVDDDESNRDMLSRRLRRGGHLVATAENGPRALEILREFPFDLVLLDLMMPEMDGLQVLQLMKGDPVLRHLPVVMLSALDEVESVVQCIEVGADDYLSKPFNPTLLSARILACLEKKRLRDREQILYDRLQEEQDKSERLLLNVLPQPIAERLKQGETTIADSFADVSVLFADLVQFTNFSAGISPVELVEFLQDVFSAFDALAASYGLEKIKTIGDSYMVVGGLPTPRPDHVEAVADMALDMREAMHGINETRGTQVQIRVGMHTGPVVAGIIGTRKFSYDLWGDTVNTASRMESHGGPGLIQISRETRDRLGDRYRIEKRGIVDVKGKGKMETYLLLGRE